MIKKIADEEMSRVTGGISSEAVENRIFIANTVVHDEAWINMVKKAAEKADSQKVFPCALGRCPGCGKQTGHLGVVCDECRKEAGCQKKTETKGTSALPASK
ncbi:MAG: hypothetical protein LBR79_00040 [Oscillospiraceae bacterium]|nr:hypothetical protein [Oscillospiraceae bacterium]